MATRNRWEDNPANRDLVDRIKRHAAKGTSYEKIRGRIKRELPSVHANTIRKGIEVARAERAWEGRKKAEATRERAKTEARERALREAGQLIPDPIRPTVHYERQGTQTQGTDARRVDVQFVDPATREMRQYTVYLPLVGTLSRQAIAAMVGSAIMQSESDEGYNRQSSLYGAVLSGIINQIW